MEIRKNLLQHSAVDTKTKKSPIEESAPQGGVTSSVEESTIDINTHTTTSDVINTNKVNELKDQISKGNYSFDLDGIAKAILDLND